MIGEVCRKLGISEQTFYRWEKRFGMPRLDERREPELISTARAVAPL